MRRAIPLLAGIGILVLSGLVSGWWTDRWSASNEPAASAAKLQQVSFHLEDWADHELPVDTHSLTVGQIAGYTSRSFTNKRTGDVVSAIVVCGRPGPILAHTPEVCYNGDGYEQIGTSLPYTVRVGPEATPVEFKVGHFHKIESQPPVHLRIFWTWNATGAWVAPDKQRLTFSPYRTLYKLYVTHQLTAGDESVGEDPSLGLIQEFMPALHKVLFPAQTGS